MIEEHEETITSKVKGASCVDDFEMSPLGKQLTEIRKKFFSEGGKFLTSEQLEREIAEGRSALYVAQFRGH